MGFEGRQAGWIDPSVGLPVSRSAVKSGGSGGEAHLLEKQTQLSASDPVLAFHPSWLLPGTPDRGFDHLPNCHSQMSRPPCEPLSPPWPTPAPLPVSVSLSWLLALRSSWSTHACNLKKLPSSPRFPPTVNLPPNLPKPNTLQNTLPLSTQTPLISSAPTPCLQSKVSKALAASLPPPTTCRAADCASNPRWRRWCVLRGARASCS